MSGYVALIIIAVLVAAALIWWLVSQNSASKDAGTQAKPPLAKSIDAPPVAAAPQPTPEKAKGAVAPLMADPKPASKTAPPKPQKAPLKKAATKAAPTKAVTLAPTKAAKPAATKPVAKAAPSKAAVTKVAATSSSKAAKPKFAAAPVVPLAKPKVAPKAVVKPKAAAPVTPKAAVKAKATAKPKAAAKIVIPNNLELLKGVGPKLNTLLKTLGVTSFEQVANWSAADVADIDAKLGTFAGRISRDNWIDQSKLLVAGDVTGFEKKYGSLGSEITKS